jgi:ketosteroid isomerase-like protein
VQDWRGAAYDHGVVKIMRPKLFSASFVVLALLSVPGYSQSPQPPQLSAQAPEPSPEVKQMQHFETSWSDAVNKGDQYELELVLSPIFVDISSAGQVTTRNQQIANLVTKTGNVQDLDQKVVTVRMLGDVALVNGTYSFKKKQEGSLVEEKGIFTHVFERTRANWLCVSSQRTPIVEESLAKKKKEKPEQKKSTAELPFHIPLLHKGAEKAPDNSATQPAPQQQPSTVNSQQ